MSNVSISIVSIGWKAMSLTMGSIRWHVGRWGLEDRLYLVRSTSRFDAADNIPDQYLAYKRNIFDHITVSHSHFLSGAQRSGNTRLSRKCRTLMSYTVAAHDSFLHSFVPPLAGHVLASITANLASTFQPLTLVATRILVASALSPAKSRTHSHLDERHRLILNIAADQTCAR
jgi:hypothetical protein